MEQGRVAIVDGFLSGDQCRFLIATFADLARSNYASGVRRLANRTEISAWMTREASKEAFELIGAIRIRIVQLITGALGAGHPLYIEYTLLSAMSAGDRHVMHADREMQRSDGRWVPNHTPHREYTGIVYLNSMGSHFTGGMLSFGELGEEIMPLAGRLVAFGCDRRYRHEVTPVSAGTRYSLACWLTSSSPRAEHWVL